MQTNSMFNNENYDKTEELADRIERTIERPLFHLCYTINPEMLVVYIAHYFDLHFRTEEEFGDGYLQAVSEAVELIYNRSHISKNEAKVLAVEITNKIIERFDAMQASKKVKEMSW